MYNTQRMEGNQRDPTKLAHPSPHPRTIYRHGRIHNNQCIPRRSPSVSDQIGADENVVSAPGDGSD